MKAIVYRGKDDLQLEEIPVPEIGAGEVLVKIDTCGICGTDLKKIKEGLVPAPRIFGHEMAGTIVKTGAGVSAWNEGERVAVYHHIPCQNCYYCSVKAFSMCEKYKVTGTTAGYTPAGGGFAEYIRVMDWIVEEGMVRLPENVTYEMASFLEPVNTCLKCIRTARVKPGETVLITGQGPIGLLLAQIAKLHGAKVIATDFIETRLQKSRSLGVDLALKADDPNLKDIIKSQTEGRGVDLAIVATANSQVVNFAMESVRYAGRVMLFAQTHLGDLCPIDLGMVCAHEKEILGSYSSSVELNREVEELVFSRKIDVESLISHRFSLDDFKPAIDLALHPDDTSLKILIQMK
jgi:L-iditol 2-dehydrogenase